MPSGVLELRARPKTKVQVFFWLVVAAVTFFAAFILPFAFPLKVAVYSPAYAAGGNNRVGALAVAVISVAVAFVCWRFNPRGLLQAKVRLRTTIGAAPLALALLATSFLTFALWYYAVRPGSYFSDSGYFLTQLRSGLIFHRELYRDVEFAYGPVLYLWPAVFIRFLGVFGILPSTAYMLSLGVMEIVGIGILYFVLNSLPLSSVMKKVSFLLLAFLSLDPQAGLNYTPLRFILPTAGIIFLSCRSSIVWTALSAALLEMLELAVSPELGIAFAVGAGAYGLYRAFVLGWRWLFVSFAAVAGAGAFYLISGPAYFHTFGEFSKGGYNLILEPAPHIYVLLFCAVCLAPLAVSYAIRTETFERASSTMTPPLGAMFIGIFMAGLVMLAPALGRCDPLHVSFNGWGLFLLAFVSLDQFRSRWKITGVALAVIFALYSVSQEFALLEVPLLRGIRHRPDLYEYADLPRLEKDLGSSRVSFPWNTPMSLIDKLTADGHYQPQYLCIPAVDSIAEQQSVYDMRRADFVLVPNGMSIVTQNPINNEGIRYAFRLGYRYKVRRAPFLQGSGTAAELAANWTRVGAYGSYTLYRKIC